MQVGKEKLLRLLTNLFNPIDNKDFGKYWFVSNNKRKPLTDADDLLRYIREDKPEGAFINRYANLTTDFIIENNIYLDFDLTNISYLKSERGLTETVLREISNSKTNKGNTATEKNDNIIKNQIKEKYSKNYTVENGFKTGFNSFIDLLTVSEIGYLTKKVKGKEREETEKLSEKELRKYYISKFEQGYLKEPYSEATKVASYFNSIGVKTVLNWSGSKGLHLRIPITEIDLSETELKENPKLFLLTFAELIETKIIGKSKGTSSLDYNVFCKGMQRLPTSKHNKTKLYANFIDHTFNYINAVDYLEAGATSYIPALIDTAKNTEILTKSDICKATIKIATKNLTENYSNEDTDPNYKFTGKHSELINIISKVYLPSCRNEVGFRIIHLLVRSDFEKKEIENIFKSLHDDIKDYKETIQGTINHAFKTYKLTGLKNLIEWLEANASEEVKTDVINYFKKQFGYYDKPTSEIVGDVFFDGNQIPICLYENQTGKWLEFEDIFNNIDLILNPTELTGMFKDSSKDTEIYSFEFKFKNKYFDIKKKIITEMKSILQEVNIDLPKFFVPKIRTALNNLDSYATDKKILSAEIELRKLFTDRTRENYARKQLGNYLNKKGVSLRKGLNTPYYLNKETNGFNSVNTDDIIICLNNNNDFEVNSISTDDVKTALTFIGDRIKPTYNIVKFPNCLYDIENFKIIETTSEPVLTLTEVQYNYNPNAQGKEIINFLETSLKHPTDTKDMIPKRINDFLEFIGYILTSGNHLNCWFIFAGIGGAGKGIATNLITEIFGSEKVGHLQIQELTPDNRFATSNLVNKQINIVTDSPTKPIEETGMLKAITGFDNIPIEFKGKDKEILPKEEVPDFLTVCNNVPVFKDGFSVEIIQRVILFEFLNQFRGTDKQNTNLLKEILNNPQNMEWLIYNGIEAYRKMITENKDFGARVSETKTRELLGKHTDPISHILDKLVKYTDMDMSGTEDYIPAKELNKLIIYVARKEGVAIPKLNKKGLITDKTLLNKIRANYDLDNNYKTEPIRNIRCYPKLYKSAQYDTYLKEMQDSENNI